MTPKKKQVTPVRKKIPEPQTWREALNVLDEFMVKNEEEASSLWLVLTALRGPDNVSHLAKHSSTVHVRKAAFPKLAGTGGYLPADLWPEYALNTTREFIIDGCGCPEHFCDHVARATQILGLDKKESTQEEPVT